MDYKTQSAFFLSRKVQRIHFLGNPKWFTVPEDYEQPTSHIVLMIVLVISAVVGSIATIYWTMVNCKRKKLMASPVIPEPADISSESSESSPSMPRLTSVHHRNPTMSR
jgi:hypothetical protein